MTFLQPFILWGLPLLLIPVIIHLLNRLRHRPQPWGAMRFLRAANRSAVSQAKLRQLLVLLFRVLAVVALVFFLSRPLAGGWLGWALSPAPEVIVLVLDRSASMEVQSGSVNKSLRQQTLDMWSEALRPFQRSRLVLVDNGSETPRELPNLGALSQPAFTGQTDGTALIPVLLQRAYTYLSDSRSGAAEVWIASDLQESNWIPADSQWERVMAQFAALPQKVRFRLLTFDSAENVSLSLAEAVRKTRNDQRSLAVTLDLQQTVPAEKPVQLRWTMGGASSQSEVRLSGQALRWRNNFPLPTGNQPGWGAIEIGADGNPADNKLFFAYESEQNPQAVVVSAAPKTAAAVQLAASDLSRTPLELAKAVTPEDFLTAPLTNTALIIWQSYTLPQSAVPILENFVRAGGSFVFFPELAPAGPSFAGLAFGEISTVRSNQVFTVTKWNDLEGPLAKTEEGFGVPLGSLEVYRRAAISGNGTVLATFADGASFLTRKAFGRGELYFCAASVESGWSSLSDGSVLVPMLQRMLASGAKRVNSAVMTDCEELRGQDLTGWEPVESGTSADPKLRAGAYRVNGRFVAVNRPAAENELQRTGPNAIRNLFANVPFQMHQERATGSDRLQGEIWRMFVTLMLIFLIVEGILILPARTSGSERAIPLRRPQPAV